MSTKIEYVTETWNPIVGCSKFSDGCLNCYGEKMAVRLAHMPHTKEKYGPVITDGKWNGNITFSPSELMKPYKWKKSRRIFVCSMGDLFHPNVIQADRDKVFKVMEDNPQHTFLILTKRAERIYDDCKFRFLPKNIWCGVTIENQEQAGERIPYLLYTGSSVLFVSIEPMLGAIDLTNILVEGFGVTDTGKLAKSFNALKGLPGWPTNKDFWSKLDWVICGAESGTKRRVCNINWIKSLVAQCESNNTPLFVKQIYIGKEKVTVPLINGVKYNQYPD